MVEVLIGKRCSGLDLHCCPAKIRWEMMSTGTSEQITSTATIFYHLSLEINFKATWAFCLIIHKFWINNPDLVVIEGDRITWEVFRDEKLGHLNPSFRGSCYDY